LNLFVIEFASKSIKLIFATVCFLAGKIEIDIRVLTNDDAEAFNFERWESNLESAFMALEAGQLSAVQIASGDNQLKLATIYCPKFIGQGIDEYTCIVDFKSSLPLAEAKANQISTTKTGLTYVCVSLEESLDISENISIDSETFPWKDWRLVLGSCADQPLKKGAAYNRLLDQTAK